VTDDVGRWGEDRAVSHLQDDGWEIEARNYSTSLGECDIIGWDGETLVFVEVKTRKSRQFGSPESAVTRDKRDHLRRVARAVLSDLERDVSCRFDVIAIEGTDPGDETELRHHENAFGAHE
jgi:putative endonuclease